ncbi:DUF3667 domain-containing protein [candidate division KSB1 bacterium]|nr:DUF3667 domain-containing protein [candidate division KSB1 bacterium]
MIERNSSPPKIDADLKKTLKHLANEVYHFDSKIFRSVAILLLKPGIMTQRVPDISNERLINPFKLYLAINFIFFLLIPVLVTPQFQVFNFNLNSFIESNQHYQHIIEAEYTSKHISDAIYAERFNAHLKYNQPALVVVLIPIFALFVSFVQHWKKRSYLEHFDFATQVITFFLVLLLLIIITFRIFTSLFNFSGHLEGILAIGIVISGMIWFVVYLFLINRNMYADTGYKAIIKVVLLFSGYLFIFSLYVQFLFFYTIVALKLGY